VNVSVIRDDDDGEDNKDAFFIRSSTTGRLVSERCFQSDANYGHHVIGEASCLENNTGEQLVTFRKCT
jgi:hypothetical protein